MQCPLYGIDFMAWDSEWLRIHEHETLQALKESLSQSCSEPPTVCQDTELQMVIVGAGRADLVTQRSTQFALQKVGEARQSRLH